MALIFLATLITFFCLLESSLISTLNNSSNITLSDSELNLVNPLITEDGLFENPWSTWRKFNYKEVLKWFILEKNERDLPWNSNVLDKYLPVHYITSKEIDEFCQTDTTNSSKIIWIGHSTCLVNFQNKIILMDPMFSKRISPLVGPKRFRPVPIQINQIPRIDAVLVSHEHLDHLDSSSVKDLNAKFSRTGIKWFVGLGLAKWFKSNGITKDVYELGWWQSIRFDNLELVFTPTQHWSGLIDRNKSLWGSWVVIGGGKKFFFGGDTGYCPVFKDIGRKFGPFDFAFIPIGAYKPRWFMSPQHVDPEEALKIHLEIKSKQSYAIHWGTFPMANEHYMEPKLVLTDALNNLEMDTTEFTTLIHGQIIHLG